MIGPMAPDSFADNISHALTAMGHVVCTPGPVAPRIRQRHADVVASLLSEHLPSLREARQRHLVSAARKFRPDLTISVDRRLAKGVINQLHGLGGVVYLWFPDAVSNLGRHEVFLAGFDRIYVKNPVLADQLKAVQGLPVHYLPEACSPGWHRSTDPYATGDHLALVGNVHPTRAILLSRLVKAGIPVKIFGSPIAPWVGHPELIEHHTGIIVRRQQKSAVFRGATAVLNNLHPAEFGGSNCRLFEATAAGGLVLTEEREGLDELFDIGRDVLTFASFDELVDLFRQAAADPLWAAGVADAGARRSLRDHTYEKRLTTMLES